MNWPQIPESFEGMDSAALNALIAEIHAARSANLPNLTADDEAEYDKYTNLERRLRVLAVDTKTNEDEAARLEAERLAAEAAAADPDPEDPPADDEPPADDGDDGDAAPGEDLSGPGGGGLQLAGVSAVQTSMSTGATRTRVADRNASRWVSTGIADNGPNKGDSFATNMELAQAILDMSSVVEAGSDKKHYLGKIQGRFAENRILDPDKPWTTLQNAYDGTDEEIEAAFCPPAEPVYDLACENSTRRPVFTGLPQYRAPARGAFTVLASPTLSSITGGYGQWTSSDDSDAEAIKEACQTITCVSPSTYEIYGIYRCLTVKNLMQMTFPELVAAYLNRLQAAAARYAEVLLLEAMGTASTAINALPLGYGGHVTLLTTILNYLALYQEQERWDVTVMDVWMPRWVLWAIKTDHMRRRNTSGNVQSVPSDEAINASFRNAGVEPHWFMDRPSWADAIPALSVGSTLSLFPRSVDFLIHRRGKFAVMDRGELSIGVTGNNMYRLEDDLRRNQFTFFFESFEGLINTDSCPAHKINIPDVCWNGVQIDDIVIDCEGQDEIGYQS